MARDVRYGLVSEKQAMDAYGVVLTAGNQANLAATAAKRVAEKLVRGEPAPFDFGYTPPVRQAAE